MGFTISLLYMVDLPVKLIILNHVRDCQAPQCHFKNRGALNSPNSPFNHCGSESRSCGAISGVGLIRSIGESVLTLAWRCFTIFSELATTKWINVKSVKSSLEVMIEMTNLVLIRLKSLDANVYSSFNCYLFDQAILRHFDATFW